MATLALLERGHSCPPLRSGQRQSGQECPRSDKSEMRPNRVGSRSPRLTSTLRSLLLSPAMQPRCFRFFLGLSCLLVLGPSIRAAEGNDWFAFDPKPDTFADSPMDLRFLNEKFAGEHGFISAKDGHFIHSANRQPVRFWAVNGPSREGKDRAALQQTARLLAKYGVNLVRRHGAVFDKAGEVDPAAVKSAIAIVEAMKSEGIYTHLSIYFPLWFTPRAGHPWMEGYDGQKHPFAALLFNPKFQEKYREWWKAVLTTPSETTGKPLLGEPALFG